MELRAKGKYGSLYPVGAKGKPGPSIGPIDVCVGGARGEIVGDDELYRRVCKEIAYVRYLHDEVSTGKPQTFSTNGLCANSARGSRNCCGSRRMAEPTSRRQCTRHEEILAVRYCAPGGELNQSIGGYLAELGLIWMAGCRSCDAHGNVIPGSARGHPTGQSSSLIGNTAIERVVADVEEIKNTLASTREGRPGYGAGRSRRSTPPMSLARASLPTL